MALTLDDIETLFATKGRAQYGREAVSQLEHALQCAHLAEEAGETAATVAAALLHDLGHLVAPAAREREESSRDAEEHDDLHQYLAIPFLRGVVPDSVIAPILMHVDAKRYLCAVEAGYKAALSPASVRSLALQGGVFSEEEAQDFVAQPYAPESIRLRRYDDSAKVPGRATPDLKHYMGVLSSVARLGAF